MPNVVKLGRSGPALRSHRGGSVFDIARDHAVDRRIVASGAELFAEGEVSDNLYVVLDGWLFLHRILEDGRRQILDFALPGAVLGYRAYAETPFTFSVEAVTNSEVAVIPLSRVGELVRCGSDCAMTLLDAANDALLGAFDTLTDIGRRTAREAVAHFLLRMDRRIRRTSTTDESDPIPFPLTQEHVGDALGLTAVHVCRTLRALRTEGLIEVGRGHLSILDKEALASEAGTFFLGIDSARLAS
jgi:CRP-like cAMP-binding protein